jgi:N-acetylglucosaminyl-diphospho-decaprenol L-rhamnosyltransferase
MDDLAVILVSHNGDRWLQRCLASLIEHIGDCAVDVVVVSNSDDGSEEIVESGFPTVRFLKCENRGFAHANNRGLITCDSRYCLFLNVDTEILSGTFEELVAVLDERPEVGMAGVRQLTAEGRIAPTMRRFPSAIRSLGEAVGAERIPYRASWLGERDLDAARYDSEQSCDWTSGSFLIVRREMLMSAGIMDERFFLYSEEPDLCLRGKQAGWQTHHLPVMTIRHYGGNAMPSPTLAAQDAYSRLQFAQKHFSFPHRAAYVGALALGYGLRWAAPARTPARRVRRQAARSALRTLVGAGAPPFGPPPQRAVGAFDLVEKEHS